MLGENMKKLVLVLIFVLMQSSGKCDPQKKTCYEKKVTLHQVKKWLDEGYTECEIWDSIERTHSEICLKEKDKMELKRKGMSWKYIKKIEATCDLEKQK